MPFFGSCISDMRTGAYYHRSVESLISFLVPAHARILRAGIRLPSDSPGRFDAVVISDVLGHVHDIATYLADARSLLAPHGRIVITQYSQLWEPFLRLASRLGLRRKEHEQNWISLGDLGNFAELAGLQVVTTGRKILFPLFIPLMTPFINRILANLPLLNRLCLVNYIVARTIPSPVDHDHSVSIIVPARNEAGTIARIIRELPVLGSSTEIIFIEGHSADDTRTVIEHEVKTYQGPKRLSLAVQDGRGKGDAVRKGFSMASGDILIIYDADMTVPATEVGAFYEALIAGRGDFINGSRLVYPMRRQSMRTLNYIANKFFGISFSWLLGQRIKDTLCGTKVLWRTDYEHIARGRAFFGEFDPFGDFDLLFGAAKLNLKIIDLPVHYGDRVYGTTNISRFRHGWLLIKMVIFAARKMKFV